MNPKSLLDADAIRRALSLRDLTDPAAGPHAMQLLLRDVSRALEEAWPCSVRLRRECPVVAVADNYDALHYPPGGAARDVRYTRYLNERVLLRTQTSAMIPRLLRALDPSDLDVLLVCPGLVYRRDSIDRLHTGEPHQVDLWRIRRGDALDRKHLLDTIGLVVEALLPGHRWQTTPADHPYTERGRQIDVQAGEEWVEIGECGLSLPALLRQAGLDTDRVSGLAMGLGLDRILTLRTGIEDIRLLRSEDPRVSGQMLDLEPYRSVSSQPPIRRDLSVAVRAGTTAEELGDWVRSALDSGEADSVEEIGVISQTARADLPERAIERIGLQPDQVNVLLRVVLRHPVRTLTSGEANGIRDRIYAAVHKGSAWQWAQPGAAGE